MKKYSWWVMLAVMAIAVGMATRSTFSQTYQTVPIYRYWHPMNNPAFGIHLYSTNKQAPDGSWQQEGIVFYVSPTELAYTVPLYELTQNGKRFYTIDAAGKDYLVANVGWQYLGILGYVLPKDLDLPGSTQLYRWVRVGGLEDHFYQTASGGVANYKSEGFECRVWTKPTTLPYNLLKITSPVTGTALKIGDKPVIKWKVWTGGGVMRLSFSTDKGGSWQDIGTIPITGNYGDINLQTYNSWQVPSTAAGSIRLRAQWFASDPDKQIMGTISPWATDVSGDITVTGGAFLLPKTVIRPH